MSPLRVTFWKFLRVKGSLLRRFPCSSAATCCAGAHDAESAVLHFRLAFDSSGGEVRVLRAGEPPFFRALVPPGPLVQRLWPDVRGPVPSLFSFNSPRGACETCQGFGRIVGIDPARVIPDARKTLRERPVAPFNSPSYESALRRPESRLAPPQAAVGRPVERAHATRAQRRLEGLGRLVRSRGPLQVPREEALQGARARPALSLPRLPTCPACHGARLRPEALAVTVGGKTIAEVCDLTLDELLVFLRGLPLSEAEKSPGLLARRGADRADGDARRNRPRLHHARCERCARSRAGRRSASSWARRSGTRSRGRSTSSTSPRSASTRATRAACSPFSSACASGQRGRRRRTRHGRHPGRRSRDRPRPGRGCARRAPRLRRDAGGADGCGHRDGEVVEEGERDISWFGKQAVRADAASDAVAAETVGAFGTF